MKICSKCTIYNTDDSEKCKFCGTSLEDATYTEEMKSPPDKVKDSPKDYRKKIKKYRKRLIFLTILLIGLIAFLCNPYFEYTKTWFINLVLIIEVFEEEVVVYLEPTILVWLLLFIVPPSVIKSKEKKAEAVTIPEEEAEFVVDKYEAISLLGKKTTEEESLKSEDEDASKTGIKISTSYNAKDQKPEKAPKNTYKLYVREENILQNRWQCFFCDTINDLNLCNCCVCGNSKEK